MLLAIELLIKVANLSPFDIICILVCKLVTKTKTIVKKEIAKGIEMERERKEKLFI